MNFFVAASIIVQRAKNVDDVESNKGLPANFAAGIGSATDATGVHLPV